MTPSDESFLDCFGEDEILSILERAAVIMDSDSRLYIMETLWDRRNMSPPHSASQISLYFTAIATETARCIIPMT